MDGDPGVYVFKQSYLPSKMNMTTEATFISSAVEYVEFYKEPIWLKIILAFLFGLISFLGVGGNAIVCYIVLWNTRMRTPTNYFIVNLAVSDLLSALLCVNFTYYATMYMYWPFGEFFCKLVQFIQNLSISVSIFTLVVISLDRYSVILYPLRPKMRKTRTLVIIAAIWLLSCIFALPIAISNKVEYLPDLGQSFCTEDRDWHGAKIYSMCALIVQYLLPLAILAVCYGRIAVAMWSRKTPGEKEEKRDRKLSESKLKLVRMFATIVILFAICYLPMYVFLLIQDNTSDIMNFHYIRLVFLGAFFIGMSNCMYNPFIYCWMNGKFRNGFKSVLRFLPFIHYKKKTDPWALYARSTLRTQMAAVPIPTQQVARAVFKHSSDGTVRTELSYASWNGCNGKVEDNTSI